MSPRPRQAQDVAAEKVEWLWRKRIPKRMITIVGGLPDQGKGLFAARVAADVSQPDPVDGNSASNVRVLYSAAEDSDGLMTRPRLEAAGAVLPNILLWKFVLPAQMNELYELINENAIGLVVMDPMASHLGGGISRHSDNIRAVTDPMAEIADATGCAFLIVEHVLKRVPRGGSLLGVIGGAGSGLPAAARAAFVFGTDPDDEDQRILVPAKFNIGNRPKSLVFETDVEEIEKVGHVPLLVSNQEIIFDGMRLFDKPDKAGKVGRPPDKRTDAGEWLINYLKDNGKTPSGKVMEDAKKAGMAVKTLRRAADDAEIVKDPPGGGRNCTWDLPDELKDMLGLPVAQPDSEEGGDLDAELADILGGGDDQG